MARVYQVYRSRSQLKGWLTVKRFFALLLMTAFICAMGGTIGCGKKDETKKEPAAVKKDEGTKKDAGEGKKS
jgi:hypothetical protein